MTTTLRIEPAALALALALPLVLPLDARAQGADTRPLDATADVVYTLRLPAEPSASLPAHAHAIAFDGAARLHVLDRASGAVWVFGRGGDLERRIELGRAASRVRQMTITADGTIVLTDPARQTLLLLDPAAPESTRTHDVGARILTGPLLPHPERGVLSRARPLPDPASDSWDLDRMPLLWFPLDGPAVTVHAFDGASRQGGRPGLSALPLFAPLSTRGVAVADPREYRIDLVQGDRTRQIARAVTPRPVAEADRRAAAASAACSAPETVGPSGRAQGFADMASASRSRTLPTHVAALAKMAWSPAGHLWVERTGDPVGRPGPVDLYTPTGSYVGSVAGLGVPEAWAWDGRLAAYVDTDVGCQTTITVRRIRVAAP